MRALKHRFVQMIVVGRPQLVAVATRRGIHLMEADGGEMVVFYIKLYFL
jgi:hypothetical protein